MKVDSYNAKQTLNENGQLQCRTNTETDMSTKQHKQKHGKIRNGYYLAHKPSCHK